MVKVAASQQAVSGRLLEGTSFPSAILWSLYEKALDDLLRGEERQGLRRKGVSMVTVRVEQLYEDEEK